MRIVPHLGGIALQDLRPRDVDAWLHKLAAEGLAKRTISNARVVLSHALKYAVYPAELIAANPCTGLSIPRSAPANVIPRVIITPAILSSLLKEYPERHTDTSLLHRRPKPARARSTLTGTSSMRCVRGSASNQRTLCGLAVLISAFTKLQMGASSQRQE